MAIEQVVARVTTTGSAGSATGTGYSPAFTGYLLDIYLNYHASAPGATTDLTVTQEGVAGNIFANTNTATDALVTPRVKPVDNANSAITNAHDRFPVNGRLVFALAQTDALTDALVATVRYETSQ